MQGKGSYEKINYSLRPAKTVERKMFCHAIHKLSCFDNLYNYQYIGFGSTYFSDFNLFHRTLGIMDLISIEKDQDNQNRFEFNRPFSCIKTYFELSNDVLPRMNWSKPTILWVDYDSKINASMLRDITTFFRYAVPGSMFIITVDIKPDKPPKEMKHTTDYDINIYRIKQLIQRIGESKAPDNIDDRILGIEGNISTVYEIIIDQINETIMNRNLLVKNKSDNNIFKQLFNIYYNDGTPMLTVGGVLITENIIHAFKKAGFDKLEFVESGDKAFRIDIPNLTVREIFSLNTYLPNKINPTNGELLDTPDGTNTPHPDLPHDDILKYLKIYRYFPTFAEALF